MHFLRHSRYRIVPSAPWEYAGSQRELVIMSRSETKGLSLPMISRKVAVLIDGGFFLKRLPSLRPDLATDPTSVAKALQKLVGGHLFRLNNTYCAPNYWSLLYRAFYYDAAPYENSTQFPISRTRLNYNNTKEAIFRRELFEQIRRTRKFALRLGEVYRENGWRLTEEASKAIRDGTLDPTNLSDRDFSFGLRQKGVDMRIGIDISSITLKKQADTIVLVAGDSDFVPAAKLARREGVEVILDSMQWSVRPELFEHIDGLYSGLPKRRAPIPESDSDVAENEELDQ